MHSSHPSSESQRAQCETWQQASVGGRTVAPLLLGGVADAEGHGMAVGRPGQAGVTAVLQTVLTCRNQSQAALENRTPC